MVLSVINLQVEQEQWETLRQNVWSHDYVNAYLSNDSNVMQPVKLRYRGGHTREYPKKSFEVESRSGTIHLNAEYDDPSMIRNALSFKFFERIGVPSPATKHCVLTLNGENLGPYLKIEGVDSRFFLRRGLPCTALFYAGNDDANFSLLNPDTNKLKTSLFQGYELVIGEQADRKRLEDFIFNLNTLPPKKLYKYLESLIDLDNYLKWLAGAVCTSNYDGFNQNYALYNSSPDFIYRIIPWDYEGSWGRNCFGERCSSRSVRIMGYNILTKKILSNKQYKKKYKEILQEILESVFTTDSLQPHVEHLLANVRPAIEIDNTRKWPIRIVAREPYIIMSYIRNRRKFLAKHLKSF